MRKAKYCQLLTQKRHSGKINYYKIKLSLEWNINLIIPYAQLQKITLLYVYLAPSCRTVEKTILQEDTGPPPHPFLQWFCILKCNHSACSLGFCTVLSHQRHNRSLGQASGIFLCCESKCALVSRWNYNVNPFHSRIQIMLY